jgi:hypothetical protein
MDQIDKDSSIANVESHTKKISISSKRSVECRGGELAQFEPSCPSTSTKDETTKNSSIMRFEDVQSTDDASITAMMYSTLMPTITTHLEPTYLSCTTSICCGTIIEVNSTKIIKTVDTDCIFSKESCIDSNSIVEYTQEELSTLSCSKCYYPTESCTMESTEILSISETPTFLGNCICILI